MVLPNPRSSGTDVRSIAANPVTSTERKIALGSITGLFGVRGWIKVFSETDPRENIVNYQHWWIRPPGATAKSRDLSSDGWRQIEVLEGRRQSKTVIARIAGIETPEAAEQLIGYEIAVDRSQMPPLKKGEFYWADLVGYTVQNLHGELLGTVERLFATGANDVVVVRKGQDQQDVVGSAAENEILIPWIMGSVIVEVDTDTGNISVDWEADY